MPYWNVNNFIDYKHNVGEQSGNGIAHVGGTGRQKALDFYIFLRIVAFIIRQRLDSRNLIATLDDIG